ncbi:MAG: hypothetical protein MJ230_06250 [bacterium]|nr:hypothetical protein [bacterium]
MKTNSIQGTSFNGVKLVGTMPKLQQRKANKLLTKIQNLPGYDLTDKNGITFLISSQKVKSIFPRRIFTVSLLKDKKTDVAKLLYLGYATCSGKSSKLLKYVTGIIEETQRTTDKVEKINTQNHAIKSMLDELKPENTVIMWGDKTLNNKACVFMYYDKQKKCANRITQENIGISTPVLKHEEFANGFECDEANKILYWKNKLRSETYSFSGIHTIDDFYPNGNIRTHKEYNGGDWEEITYDELGRMKTLHKEEFGIYITDEKYNPETGEIIENNNVTL